MAYGHHESFLSEGFERIHDARNFRSCGDHPDPNILPSRQVPFKFVHKVVCPVYFLKGFVTLRSAEKQRRGVSSSFGELNERPLGVPSEQCCGTGS